MAITGYLADFSLAEIFKFLEQGNKSGLLNICPLTESQTGRHHYIWFNQGRIVAASSTLNQQGLTSLIAQRGWLGDRAASRLAQTCTIGTPLGLCLKSQGALNSEHLKLLFYSQVMRQVCALFELEDGWFQFDNKAPLPTAEMTGLSAPATDVTLAGLRALKDWRALADKLPDASSALISAIDGKPQLKLNQVEWQVWEFTQGTTALTKIAQQLQLSIEQTRQIAFRLIVAGIAEEIPLAIETTPMPVPEIEPIASTATAEASVSSSFLQNLVGFLKGKI